MKKILTITTALLVLICFSTVSAHAGSGKTHTMEGVILGAGIVILGSAIISGINRNHRPQYSENNHREQFSASYRQKYDNRHHRQFSSPGTRGYWTVKRVWADPVYGKKWNPGHYNSRGVRVNGRNQKYVVKNGYWHEEKVWVRR